MVKLHYAFIVICIILLGCKQPQTVYVIEDKKNIQDEIDQIQDQIVELDKKINDTYDVLQLLTPTETPEVITTNFPLTPVATPITREQRAEEAARLAREAISNYHFRQIPRYEPDNNMFNPPWSPTNTPVLDIYFELTPIDTPTPDNRIQATYVYDGDTIRVSTGESVRLIGINAPESGQPCYDEATTKLSELLLWKEVTLEGDVEDKDQHGRLLRYVHADNTFINLEMVRLGFAHAYEYGSNNKYSSLFTLAEEQAKEEKSCIWTNSQEDYVEDKCLQLIDFHPDAYGDDNYNLNDEYLILGNKCAYSIDMSGWTIKDATSIHIFSMPTYTLEPMSAFTLHTGTGTNSQSELYWGRTSGEYAAIWNNNGDSLFLRDSKGLLVLDYSY
ncbi:MAG: thermonuclease family protein [Candidatus Thorarchaeota archaeon]